MEKQLDSLQERFEASATRMEEKLEELLTRMEVKLFSMQQQIQQQIQQSIPQSTPHLIPSIEVTKPNLTSTSWKGTPVKRKFPKFPFFKEGDPRKWICEIEEYFDFYEIPGVHKVSESQKLNCATLHLRGRASQWFHRHIKPRIHEMSWSLFLEKLIDQFDSTELEDSNKSMVVDEENVIDGVSCEKNRDGVVFDSLENLEMENYRSDKSSKVFDELENQGKEKLIDQFDILEIEVDDADLGRKIQEDVVVEDGDVVEGENQQNDKAAVALDKKNVTWETNLMDGYEEKFKTFFIVIEENEEKLMFAKKISKMSSSSVCGNVSNTILPNIELRLSFRRNVKRAEFEVHTVVIGSDKVMLNGWPPPICINVAGVFLLHGYSQRGDSKEVLVIFNEVLALEIEPNNFTLVNALSACSQLLALEQGKWVHLYIDRSSINLNAVKDMFVILSDVCVESSYGLWLTSAICEIWFAVSWVLDQFPKWYPINKETYIDRLSARYERNGEFCDLCAGDYPVEKVSCYVSDDGSAMLSFESLAETAEFARKWVPFCKKYSIEPRAPEFYSSQKFDYLKDKVQPSCVKERRTMKRDYEEYKVRVNALVAKAQKTPEEGWIMQDGTSWPGNNPRDHPGMIQVFLGNSGAHDIEGNELPRLVYVSGEKRPGYQHHKKAGAMNALGRVSAILTNADDVSLHKMHRSFVKKNTEASQQMVEVSRRPDADRSKWFKQFPWEGRLKKAHEQGTLVFLENFDRSFTSRDIDDESINSDIEFVRKLTYLYLREKKLCDVLELVGISKLTSASSFGGELYCQGEVRFSVLDAGFNVLLIDFGWLKRCSKEDLMLRGVL